MTPVHHEPGPARPASAAVWLERRGKRLLTWMLRRILHPRRLDDEALQRLEVRELLLIRQHNQMGDMVLCLPALRALRARWPRARLRFVTAPLCEELLRDHEDIDELLVFRKRSMRRPWALGRWLRQLRRPRADVAIVLGSVSFSTTSALLALASRARVRIGAPSRPFGSELSGAIYHRELGEPVGIHEVERNLSTLRAIGITAADALPRLRARSDAVQAARRFLAQAGADRCVVLHTGAGKLPNVWPAEAFAQLADRLASGGNIRFVLTEGPRDAAIVEAVQRHARVDLLRWRGELDDTLGLLEMADLVVSNDTGMAHVAAALGRPTLVLFGPTDPQRWRPAGPHVRVLASPTRRMPDLPVEAVARQATAMLGETSRPDMRSTT